MFVAALFVGVVVVWVLVDQLLIWHGARQHRGPSAWRENAFGTALNSSGIEETQTPQELLNLRYG